MWDQRGYAKKQTQTLIVTDAAVKYKTTSARLGVLLFLRGLCEIQKSAMWIRGDINPVGGCIEFIGTGTFYLFFSSPSYGAKFKSVFL
ncbi:MAG: hypothetical protein FWD31_04230 [Planctomycetaceae bacterium]|nr:hypothetical protein [Planctomycetaceae bacterium]